MVRKRKVKKVKTNKINSDIGPPRRCVGGARSPERKRRGGSYGTNLCYQLNPKWPFLTELKNLVLKISPPSFPKIERGLARLGKVKLAVVTGVFLGLSNTRVDIMVVGDDIDFRKFGDFIKKTEDDLGVELRYVVLGVEEFRYRFNMFDRFVHDILEYPHRKVINKLAIKGY